MRGNTRPVVLAAVVTLPVTFIADIVDSEGIDATTYLGLGGMFTVLAFMAEGAPQLASGIAWLVTVVILLTRGSSVLEAMGGMGAATVNDRAKVVSFSKAQKARARDVRRRVAETGSGKTPL